MNLLPPQDYAQIFLKSELVLEHENILNYYINIFSYLPEPSADKHNSNPVIRKVVSI